MGAGGSLFGIMVAQSRFSPVSGPFWVRFGVRVSGWVYARLHLVYTRTLQLIPRAARK